MRQEKDDPRQIATAEELKNYNLEDRDGNERGENTLEDFSEETLVNINSEASDTRAALPKETVVIDGIENKAVDGVHNVLSDKEQRDQEMNSAWNDKAEEGKTKEKKKEKQKRKQENKAWNIKKKEEALTEEQKKKDTERAYEFNEHEKAEEKEKLSELLGDDAEVDFSPKHSTETVKDSGEVPIETGSELAPDSELGSTEIDSTGNESVDNQETITELRELEKDLYAALDNNYEGDRKILLEKAADILGNDKYKDAVLKNSKDKKDYLVPQALEDALAAVEEKIKTIEDQDWLDTAKKEIVDLCKKRQDLEDKYLKQIADLPNDLSGNALHNTLNDIHAACYEEVMIDEDTSSKTEAPMTETTVETNEGELAVETNKVEAPIEAPVISAEKIPVDDARADFYKEVHRRGKITSTKRKLGTLGYTEKAQAEYDEKQDNYLLEKTEYYKSQLTDKKEELLKANPELSLLELNGALGDELVELLKNEEANIDELASTSERSVLTKCKNWWRKTWKKRLLLGVGMIAAGFATGGITAGVGVLAVLGSVRFVTGTAGAFMATESGLDRTKTLGQKGMADDLKHIGLRGGLLKFVGRKEVKITEADKDTIFNGLMDPANAEKYSAENLGLELARLRILSFDKGVGIKDAARFGEKQKLVVEAIQEAYFAKQREVLVNKLNAGQSEGDGKAEMVVDFMAAEKEATDMLAPEQDKSRLKAMARVTAATGMAIGAGWLIGNSALDKVSKAGTPDVDPGSVEPIGPPEPVEPMGPPEPIPAVSPEVVTEHVVAKGDNVWNIVSGQLQESMSAEEWKNLGEAGQTHLIDQFKDTIVANPEDFGIPSGMNIDNLKIGTELDFHDMFNQGGIDEAMGKAGALTAEQADNIVANNEAIATAAKDGISITTEHVDGIAAEVREYKVTDWISKDGVVREWALDGQAAALNENGVMQLVDNPDLDISDRLSEVINHDQEVYKPIIEAPVIPEVDHLSEFLERNGVYSSEIFEQVSGDPEKLDNLINHVFESDHETQMKFLQDYGAGDFTVDNNKATIFLKLIDSDPDLHLRHIDSINDLQSQVSRFDEMALSNDLPGKEWEARLLVNPDGKPVYALVHLVKHKFLGIGQDVFATSDGVDLAKGTKNVSENVLKATLGKSEIPEVDTIVGEIPVVTPEAVEAASDTSGVSETITPKPEAVPADTTQVEAPVAQTPKGVPGAGSIEAEAVADNANVDGVSPGLKPEVAPVDTTQVEAPVVTPEAVEAASDTSGVSETITPKPEAVEAASDTTQVEAPVVTPEAADQFTLDSIMSSENIEDGVEFELEGKIFMKEGGKLLVKAGTKNLEVPDEAAFNRLLNR